MLNNNIFFTYLILSFLVLYNFLSKITRYFFIIPSLFSFPIFIATFNHIISKIICIPQEFEFVLNFLNLFLRFFELKWNLNDRYLRVGPYFDHELGFSYYRYFFQSIIFGLGFLLLILNFLLGFVQCLELSYLPLFLAVI